MSESTDSALQGDWRSSRPGRAMILSFLGALCALARGGRAFNVKEGAVVKVPMRASIKRLSGALLLCAGMVACLLAISPAVAGAKGGKSCRAPKSAWKFVSTKLRPPRIRVCTRKHGTTPGMAFIGPFHDAQYGGFVGQAGALMVDQGGNPVWFHPAPKNQQDSNFETQAYGSSQRPALTFWQGEIAIPPHTHGLPAGAPVKGKFLLYNKHYKQIRTIKAQGKGWITDFHELILTKPTSKHKQGTAVFLAAKKIRAKHSYEDQEVQEIDLATNKLIFTWDVAKHVPLSASRVRAPRSGTWDPYHANSVDVAVSGDSLAPAGDMLVSLRNTWGAYDVSPSSGKIRWKLINGKGSKYKVSGSARFFWQHDVRFAGKNKISMFDDGCCNLGVSGPEHAARGLVLSLSKGRASVASQYHHPNTHEVPTSGNVQFLPKGHTFIGWGQSWFYSEYAGPKSMVYDAAMPKPDMSYRAYKAQWSGLPSFGPAFAVRKGKVYISWNGATGVAKWRVFAGKSKSKLKPVASGKRKGFETALRTKAHGPYFQVKAYDAHGHLLGESGVKKVSG
jgi:hypothetical protein